MPLKSQKGFYLLESLIAAILIGGIFLTVFLIELGGFSDTRAAEGNYQAVLLAKNMADRIRANKEKAIEPSGYSATAAPTGAACTANCSIDDIQHRDLVEWYNQINELSIAGVLPFAQAQINYSAVTLSGVSFAQYEIDINWVELHSHNEQAKTNDAVNRNYTLLVRIAL